MSLSGGRPRGVALRPWVFAHRGASGYLPEHTLAAYSRAVALGAHVIEPDLVCTSDGVLVVRHEPEISTTTDVADRGEFTDRCTTKTIDERVVSGWFVEDFSYPELRTLKVRERLPGLRPGSTQYDGRWPIPTFAEVLRLRASLARRYRRRIGVAPELKHPSYLRGLGLNPERGLMDTLRRFGLVGRGGEVWIQCFEVETLIRLRRSGCGANLLLLVAPELDTTDLVMRTKAVAQQDLVRPLGLQWLRRWIDGIGPDKAMILPPQSDGSLPPEPTRLVKEAHRAGLAVIPWTFRAENAFLPKAFRRGEDPGAFGDLAAELQRFLAAGIDGFFTDHADLGCAVRGAWLTRRGDVVSTNTAAVGVEQPGK